MSRLNRNETSANPISHYISFNGSTGKFKYWDKSTKQNFEMDSIDIMLLDIKTSISGYNNDTGSQISSNMVTNTNDEILTVRSWKDGKGAVIAEGLYKDIKDQVKSAGGKYTQNLLCLVDLEYGDEVICLQLKSTSLGAWIKFRKENKGADAMYDNILTFHRGSLCKRGDQENVKVTEKEYKELEAKIKKDPMTPRPVWFYVPTCDINGKLTDELVAKADQYTALVEEYFKPKTKDEVEAINTSNAVNEQDHLRSVKAAISDNADELEEAATAIPF